MGCLMPGSKPLALLQHNFYYSEIHVLANDDCHDESDGDSIIVEAKTSLKFRDLSKLIGMTVVSSFIEHNLHKDLNPMVPGLLINTSMAYICLYDCVNDYLLISDIFKWVDFDNDTLKVPALWVIWFMIHHRYVYI